MNLYLVQHAEARSEQEDPERSLTEKGWNDIRKVSSFIAKQTGIQVNRILHSGKTRARQTAEALAEQLKPVQGIRIADGLDPLANPLTWAKRLDDMDEDIMLVGHLPHLSKLAALLLCGNENKEIVKFQNAGVVCLGKDEYCAWSVQWIVIPKILQRIEKNF